MVRTGTAGIVKIYSDSNVVDAYTSYAELFASTPAKAFGWDIKVDISKQARVSGPFCFNTNTGLGHPGGRRPRELPGNVLRLLEAAD